jgi:four helix bundle protein
MNPSKPYFDQRSSSLTKRSIQFVAWSSPLLEKLTPKLAVCDQLDRAATSIALNIAEGNAKYTAPDRCRYFDTARGSALECTACLDVLVAKGRCTVEETREGKEILYQTVSLLIGLIKSVSPDRLGEDPVPYRVSDG